MALVITTPIPEFNCPRCGNALVFVTTYKAFGGARQGVQYACELCNRTFVSHV